MARVYSRKHGKSGSSGVPSDADLSWVAYSKEEVKKLVLKYASEGLTASQIGLRLRDTYGIPSVQKICGEKVTDILSSNGVTKSFPEDLMALFKKAVDCYEHILVNNQDKVAKRGLVITRSKINRLSNYYKAKGLVEADFRFDVKTAKLLID